jgi:type II secretory pathway pseudopilin PulG
MRCSRCRMGPQMPDGYSLLGLLILVALMGLALGAMSTVWTTGSTREKERQLLWIGVQFRDALASYAKSSQGAATYPTRLEDLLEDPRFPGVRRHLRRIYPDPFTGKATWGLVKAGEAIVGVYSLAPGAPVKIDGFDTGLESFAKASTYADWKFVDSAGSAALAQGTSAASAPPPPPSQVPPIAVTAAPIAAITPAQPEPQRSPAEEQRKQRQCDTQRKAENRMCNTYASTSGRGALQECQRSVDQRYDFCVNDPNDGSVPPGLDIPSQ